MQKKVVILSVLQFLYLTINTINSIETIHGCRSLMMSVDDEEASIDYIVTSNISDTTQVLLDALELGLRTMAAG